MSRYGNVKAGAYNKLNVDSESSDTSEKLNDVERVLNKMGISIRKTNLEFKDFDEVLNEIAEKWGTLDNVSKRAISNAFAGVRQQEAFMILLENYDKYKDLLEVSEHSQGTAEKKYQSYKDSYAFARNELTAALEQVANSSELSKLLTDLTKVGTNMVEVLQKIYPFLPGIISNFMMYRTIQGKGLLNSGYNLFNRMNGNGAGSKFGAISGYGYGVTPMGRTGNGLWEGIKQKFLTGSFRDIDANAEIQKINNKETLSDSRLNKRKAKIIAEEMGSNHFTVVESIDPYTGKSRKYTMYGTHKANERISELDEKTEKKRQRVEEIAKKQKDRDEKIKQKQEQRYKDQQLKYAKQAYQYSLNELNLKKQLLVPAQKEVLSKHAVLNDSTKEELVSKGLLQSKQQELSYEQAIAILDSGVLDGTELKKKIEEEIYDIDLQRRDTEREISENDITNVKGARAKIGEHGGIYASPQAIKARKWRAGLSYVEMGANLVMTSLSQLSTAATTHTYNGETVESSKEAQKKGAGVSAAISLIPIVGSFLGPLIGEAIAAATDEERDRANYETKTANENLNKLESLTSSLEQISSSEIGGAERHKLVQEFRKNIFDEENADLRKQLQKHLGSTSISSLLDKIDSNTAGSKEALESMKQLQVAQIEAEKAQIYGKYSSTVYEQTRELNEILSEIDDYSGYNFGNIMGGVGIATGGGLAGAGAGALAGLTFGSAAGPVGIAVGAIIGGIAGLIGGIVGGANYTQNQAATNRANHGDLSTISSWSAKNSLEKVDSVREALKETQDAIAEKEASLNDLEGAFVETFLKRNETGGVYGKKNYTVEDALEAYKKFKNGNTSDDILNGGIYGGEFQAAQELKATEEEIKELKKLSGQYESLISALDRQTSIQMQILDEMNELTLQQALVTAQQESSGKYISEMSIEELKNVGIEEILTIFAHAIEEAGGLAGVSVWADSGKTKLNESGYDYLYEALRKQGDEEINAVLGGEAYTLQEAINLRSKFGADNYQVRKILANFTQALNLTSEDLEEGSEKLEEALNSYGLLTLSDVLMSTSDMSERVGNFTELIGSITSGAGETSAWMEKIISQFPQLTKYMGDTSELFAQSIKYMSQYSNAYIEAQGQEIMDSTALFDSIKEDLYGAEGISDNAKNSMRAFNVTNLSSVFTWLQTQYDVNKKTLTQDAQDVLNTLTDMADKANMKIVSKIDKAYYDMLIEYKTKTIDYILENLNAQKEAMQNINSEREYENKLIEARLKLEDASKQKKRVYRAGVGWVYEADQGAIEEAQKELDTLDREKQIAKLEDQIAVYEKQKEDISQIYEKENYETLKKLYTESVNEGKISEETNNAISDLKDAVDGISVPLSEYLKQQLAKDTEGKQKALSEAETAWQELRKANPSTEGYNKALENFHNKMKTAEAYGVTEQDLSNWRTYYRDDARNISAGASAWSIYKNDIEKQKMYTKKLFNVNDLDDEDKRYVGFANGDLLTDSQVANEIFEGIQNGDAIAWTESEGAVKVGDDLRFQVSSNDTNLTEYFKRITEAYPELGNQILISDPNGDNEAVFYDNGKLYKVTNDYNDDDSYNGLQSVDAEDLTQGAQFAKEWEGVNKMSPEEIEAKEAEENAKMEELWGKVASYYSSHGVLSGNVDEIISKLKEQPEFLQYAAIAAIKQAVENEGGTWAEGSLGVKGGLSLINEEGTEAIITPQGTLTALPSGTGVIPADITKNLWELGEIAPSLLRVLGGTDSTGVIGSSIFDRIANDESFNISNLTMNVDADSSFDVDKFINSIKSRVALTKNSSR